MSTKAWKSEKSGTNLGLPTFWYGVIGDLIVQLEQSVIGDLIHIRVGIFSVKILKLNKLDE